MQNAPTPIDEGNRLAALKETQLLDSAPDAILNGIVEIAREVSRAPIALISLIDSDRQWFKAKSGLEAVETHRDFAFCAHAVMKDAPFEVRDTLEDERFFDNPLVKGAPYIRSYLGIPLRSRNGYLLGTLCVIDQRPQIWAQKTVKTLQKLAQLTEQLIHNPETQITIPESLLSAGNRRISQNEAHLILKQVFAASRIGAWSLDLKTDALYWDANTKKLHEVPQTYTPDVETAINFYTEASQPIVRAALEKAQETGESWDLELDLLTSKGREIHVRATGEVLKENGEPVRLVGLFQDITALAEQKHRYERALEEAETAILDLTNVQDALQRYSIVAISNEDGIYTYANEAFLTATGKGYSEIVGQNSIQLVLQYNEQKTVEEIIEVTSKGQSWNGRLRWDAANGTRWANSIIVPISADDGVSKQYMTLAQDITSFVEREEQLVSRSETAEELSNAKTIFLAKLGHEIRTPLNAIVALSKAFDRSNLTDSQSKDLDLMATSGLHLSQLLTDILEVSAIETGLVSLRPKTFNLNELISQSVALYQQQAREQGLDLTYRLASSADQFFYADADRIRQVISNLVTNALKFTKEGGISLTVGLYSTAGHETRKRLRLEISDTGTGISAEDQVSIFNAFKQGGLEGATTTRGVGLGLWLSKQICETMGGSLELTRSDSTGTTFSAEFNIDIASESTGDAALPIDISASPHASRMRVLAAEDHPANQHILSVILNSDQFDLTIVESGREVIDAYKIGGFDIILMDLEMPDIDGFKAIKTIRKAEEDAGAPNIPIIAVSAHGTDDYVERATACGAHAHLLKPFTPADLIEAVSAFTFLDD